jgi:hypothetical protein
VSLLGKQNTVSRERRITRLVLCAIGRKNIAQADGKKTSGKMRNEIKTCNTRLPVDGSFFAVKKLKGIKPRCFRMG